MVYRIIGAIITGYLLGSIPLSYVIPRIIKNKDIREIGSRNVGTLAVWREVNPLFGIVALIWDMGKGTLTIYTARWLGLEVHWVCVAGFAAVAGHDWPVFLKFHGGKGAATIMGIMLAFSPLSTAIGMGIAAIVIIFTSNVRLGILGLIWIPLIAWLFNKPAAHIYYPLALLIFLIVYTLIGLKGELAKSGERKGLIVDREYNFWQTKKPGNQ